MNANNLTELKPNFMGALRRHLRNIHVNVGRNDAQINHEMFINRLPFGLSLRQDSLLLWPACPMIKNDSTYVSKHHMRTCVDFHAWQHHLFVFACNTRSVQSNSVQSSPIHSNHSIIRSLSHSMIQWFNQSVIQSLRHNVIQPRSRENFDAPTCSS